MSATILPPASESPNHHFTFWPAASYTPHQTVIVNAGKNISEGHLAQSRESVWKLLMWKDATQHQCATRSKQADQKSSGWTIFCRKIPIRWKGKGFPPPPDPELLFSFQHIRHDPPKSFWQPKFKGFQVLDDQGAVLWQYQPTASAGSAAACLPAIPVVGKILDSCSENSEKNKYCSFLKWNLSLCCHSAGSVTSSTWFRTGIPFYSNISYTFINSS